ncbi:MAG: hypothetical protein DRP45_10090 [Candidatus Zixiibacteriota bacterium]|nr:MAG: hypothetical protein DRP45_10090 [candidate division Zixibacteria bacterium]
MKFRSGINIFQALVLFVCGAAAPVGLGVLWVGTNVFDFSSPAVMFLLFGVGCSLVFVLHRWRGLWPALIAAILLTFVFALSAGGLEVSGLVHSVLILLATVFVREFMWGKIFGHIIFGKFIHTAIVLAAASFLATTILSVIYDQPGFVDALVRNGAQACLVGFGLGLGMEIGAILIGRPGDISVRKS